jgi:hypothetical protein
LLLCKKLSFLSGIINVIYALLNNVFPEKNRQFLWFLLFWYSFLIDNFSSNVNKSHTTFMIGPSLFSTKIFRKKTLSKSFNWRYFKTTFPYEKLFFCVKIHLHLKIIYLYFQQLSRAQSLFFILGKLWTITGIKMHMWIIIIIKF